MYIILVYDIGEKRRQYVNWIQNSVCEGDLTNSKLQELTIKIKFLIDTKEDSVILFTNKMDYNMNKQIIGKERMDIDNFL